VGSAEWLDAWGLLVDVANSIVEREGLPSEDDLLKEVLAPKGLVP
jgi:hypothetical protein